MFNPCRENQLLDEPVKHIPPIEVSDFQGATAPYPIFAAFTGTFLLGLKPVENLPPIDVVIGESISNSKTKPQDLGSYSIQAEAINDVKSQSIQTTAYNYGSTWNYPVNNLIMKHQESFDYNFSDNNKTPPIKLIYAVNDKTTSAPVSVCSVVDGEIPTLDMEFKKVSTISPYIEDLDYNIILPQRTKQGLVSPLLLKTEGSNPAEYYLVQDEEEFEITGEEIKAQDSPYYYITSGEHPTIQAMRTLHYINPDWVYTTNCLHIIVGIREHGSTGEFHFENRLANNGLYYNTNNPKQQANLITFDKAGTSDNDFYTVFLAEDIDTPPDERTIYDAIFKVYDDNTQDYVFSNLFSFWWVGELKAEEKESPDDHKFIITAGINTGFIDSSTYDIINPKLYNKPFQLTNNQTSPEAEQRTLNPEDLLVSAEQENGKYGLKFRLKEQPVNVVHMLTYEGNNSQPTITNIAYKWFFNPDYTPHRRDQEMLAFIPLKTQRPLTRFSPEGDAYDNSRNFTNYQNGFFYIKTLDGRNTDELIDSKVEVFLAGGHESLNVEPPQENDRKFKTFNGSLTFDRSDSRITRLFSNDITGSCLGYLNDILSAKLSRYYYISNLNIWNCFLATESKIIINNNPKALNANYSENTLYSGNHEIVFSSCFDIVKLIGSENVVNNCLSSLQAEQQAIPTNIWTYEDLLNDSKKEHLKDSPINFYYKFFHFYNSALNEEPHNGLGVNDSSTTTIGGLNLLKLSDEILACGTSNIYRRKNSVNTKKPFYVMSGTTAYYNLGTVKSDLNKNTRYNTNRNLVSDGYIETLPAYRIYKNANFEQSDLTITTGGIKTLHPIYIQSTPKILINNILYFADFVINYLLGTFGDIDRDEDMFGYVHVLLCKTGPLNNLPLDGSEYPLFRFGKVAKRTYNGDRAIAMSFDSLFMLNYINTDSLNEYQTLDDIKTSIPGSVDNEEVLSNIKTGSPIMNVQLFSKRYFDFLDGVDDFGMVVMKFQYIEQVIFNDSVFALYYNINKKTRKNQKIVITQDVELQTRIQNLVDSFINNISSYNNLKNAKILIIKLGEFLQFPKILYGTSHSFNKALNVNIDNLNMAKYKSAMETKFNYRMDDEHTQQQITETETTLDDSLNYQKINVYLYGVMFKYHQLALGYQNLNNEISEEFQINKALGNRHFELIITDEYGRLIPNTDTSQGFKNNLYLELSLV